MAEERVQRRLAAILAADVVGYSRLIGADEAETRARFNALMDAVVRPAMENHRGRLVKTMGDGLLAEFASVVDAVQWATDVQRGMAERAENEAKDRRLQLRVGIHLGDVIVEGDDIHGDGVNIAARLEGLAEPGGICVSDMVRAGVRGKLALDFDDIGEQSLKNIAEPVRVFRVVLADGPSGGDATSTDALFRRPAVAVLPFENISGDVEQEYFADGITEDIITALSRIREFFVIARNTTFTYKKKAVDVKAVARDLGVRYVLEGSVRKAGNRVRITAQLIDGDTGSHIWAERYDRELQDVFAVQDEITQTVSAEIEPALSIAEQKRAARKNPASLDGWDYYQRAMEFSYRRDKESCEEAVRLLERCLSIDATFSRAWSALANVLFTYTISGYSTDKDAHLNRIVEAGTKAVRYDNDDNVAHDALGRGLLWRRDYAGARREFEKSIQLNPASARGYYGYGMVLLHSGEAERAAEQLGMAIKLSPRDPRRHAFYSRMAYAQLALRNPDAAVEWANKAISEPVKEPASYLFLLSALGHMKRIEDALSIREELAQLQPKASVTFAREQIPSVPEYLDYLLDGLRKAGLPE